MAEPTIEVPLSTMRKIAVQLKELVSLHKRASAVEQSKVVSVADSLIKAGAYNQSDREALTRSLLAHNDTLDVLAQTANKIQPRGFGSAVSSISKKATKGFDIDQEWFNSITR